ncbi:MAG: CPBP family glutamic-type intramembrane protease [Chloroflexota bacterium]|nr:MAG: hypothetical protein DLM70_15185 [Chloroflexota bacterium]
MTTSTRDFSRIGLLLVGLGLTMVLRLAIAGNDVTQSAPAGLTFAMALVLLAAVAGWRVGRLQVIPLLIGIVGGGVLIVAPAWMHLHATTLLFRFPAGFFVAWAAVVGVVAVAEEILLRGVLFSAVNEVYGPMAAVALTSIAFGLLHVPLYGWNALPLDLAVGFWLGGLRLLSGGVTAPAVAHVLADVAAWWLL